MIKLMIEIRPSNQLKLLFKSKMIWNIRITMSHIISNKLKLSKDINQKVSYGFGRKIIL